MPLKIAFFLWRMWKGRIATDDNLKRMKIHVVSRCFCCDKKEMEIGEHLFLIASTAQRLWKQFVTCAGIKVEGKQLHQLIQICWNFQGGNRLKKVMQIIPAVIVWELWKRRNAYRHGISLDCLSDTTDNNLVHKE